MLGQRPEQKVHIFGKINNYLAERVSLLLLSEVCLVTINTHISVFPPISYSALSKSKYVI